MCNVMCVINYFSSCLKFSMLPYPYRVSAPLHKEGVHSCPLTYANASLSNV